MGSAKPRDVDIIPLQPIDQWRPIDNIRSLLFCVVGQQLDGHGMRDALDRLVRNHLPILGARLRPHGKRGGLAYHQPTTLPDDGRALFAWSSRSVDSALAAANLLPSETQTRAATAAFIGPASVPHMEAHWIPPDWPLERRLEQPDTPLLLVHTTSYTDATVVALNLPHAVSDQMGYASMIRAWMQVVAGQEPAPFLTLQPGQLDGPRDMSKKELRKKKRFRITTKPERAAVLIGLAPAFVLHPKEARRTLILPVTLVDGLRGRFNESLKAKHGKGTAALNNGDVVCAILAKFAYLGRKSPKMMTLSSTVNARGRHPALPADRPYLHNCVAQAVTRMPISRDTPLAELAYRHRLAVLRAMEPAEIERSLAVSRELCRRRYVIHVCEPLEVSYSVTNWSGAWHGIDFAPAVATAPSTKTTGDAEPVSAVPLILGHSLERDAPTRLNSQIMCKANGGYWCDFGASTRGMAQVEELLRSDPRLETL